MQFGKGYFKQSAVKIAGIPYVTSIAWILIQSNHHYEAM